MTVIRINRPNATAIVAELETVLATYDLIGSTPECIARIWRERNGGHEADVGPKATTKATLPDAVPLQAGR